MQPARIWIVEDDERLLEALARALRNAGYAVSTHGDAESLLEALERDAPPAHDACVLMDMNLGATDGLQAQRRVRQLAPSLPIVFVSGVPDAASVNQAWRDGAREFLFKPFTPEELLNALARVLRQPAVASSGAPDASPLPALQVQWRERALALTERQRQVLEFLAVGHTHKQIAQALSIAPRTVKLYRAALIQRSGCANLAELVRFHEACKDVLAR